MSFYIVTGKLGNGKTLASISMMDRKYFSQGRRVATNLDLFLQHYHNRDSRLNVLRLPDKPSADDLWSMGQGYDFDPDSSKGYDENKNGLLVLDECGTWFDSRGWNDPSRKEVNNWFVHARKLGWDVMLIIHSVEDLDSKARRSFAEYTVFCHRMDNFRIPLLGFLTKTLFGSELRLPRIHYCSVRYGCHKTDMKVDSWTFLGRKLYSLYNTRQAFSDCYDTGSYSVLSPWHQVGRYYVKKPVSEYLNQYLLPVLFPYFRFMYQLINLCRACAACGVGVYLQIRKTLDFATISIVASYFLFVFLII